MKKYISILRGINVSGQKKILMKDLKTLYEELNFKNVITYIQSGNVIFDCKEDKNIKNKIEQKIFEKYNFHVPVIIRTEDEVLYALNNNPFFENDNGDNRLYVTFLDKEPEEAQLKSISAFNFEPDKFIISGKEIYMCVENGYGNTKLSNNFFENKLKVTATTRNWKTVNELYKIASSQK